MAHMQAARLALISLSVTTVSSFVPFAGVEELKPQRLHDFCGSEVLERRDGHGALRHCQHSFSRRLEDESDLELAWSMDVDPDSILSLDTEAEHGVRLTRCSDSELELELPEGHAHHAAEGKIIVGSRFAHNCAHRPDTQLLHRVTKVHSKEWRGGRKGNRAVVRLGTQELENLAHAVPSYKFYFSWMPAEARDDSTPFPEMKTDYGLNREYLETRRRKGEAEARRLFGMPSLSLPDSVSTHGAGMQTAGRSSSAFNAGDSMFSNLKPKRISNFGWNWDFFMNTTQQPNFTLNVPGIKGRMKIRKPFIKVHSGIYLNFSSEIKGLTTAPLVHWTAGTRGHGHCAFRMIGSMNTTGDAGIDPFYAFKLPIFQELEQPKWFGKLDIATGNLPISLSPGLQMTGQMYHKGDFHGGVGLGLRTHGTLNPTLHYDSLKGFDMDFQGKLKNFTLWPPLWMIFTKHFEMGIMLKPSLLMHGDFAGMEKGTMAIELRPYTNITVTREGTGATAAGDMKTLTVYPMRIMGLSDATLQKKYKVRVSVMGHDLETSPQLNFGEVEFRDHISKFNCGDVPQKVLMNPTSTPIVITVLEVDPTTNTDVVIGTGQAVCASLLNGECQPSPMIVSIVDVGSQIVASVQLAMIWSSSPTAWFASQIRGLAFSFPQVILRQSTISASFPGAVTPASQLTMHLIRGGQTYVINLAGTIGEEQSTLSGDTTIQFTPYFTDTWLPCPPSVQTCESPRLELYAGSVQIGIAQLPLLDFSSQTAMQGTQGGGGFLAGSTSGDMNVPSTIAITAPGNSASTVALATMNSQVVMTMASSMVVQPRAPKQVVNGGTQPLVWTVSNVDAQKAYDFTMAAYKLTPVAATSMQAYANFRQVNGQVLMPIQESIQKASIKCEQRGSKTMAAAKAPCSFAANFKIPTGIEVGNTLVVMIAWAESNSNSQMYTMPLQVVSSVRRLNGSCTEEHCGIGEALGEEDDVEEMPSRRLFSAAAWNARVQQHKKSCDQKNLKFNVGMGMLMRGQIKQISVPKGFPMLGGLSEQPELATGFRKIAGAHPGEEMQDAVGGKDNLVCRLGLCKGALPGCSEVNNRSVIYRPVIVFNTSRPYHFNQSSKGNFHGLMKEALAYAFSTLPEMVDVVVKEMKDGSPWKANTGNIGGVSSTTPPPASNWWTSEATTAAPSVQWPSSQVTQAPSLTQAPSWNTPAPSPTPSVVPAAAVVPAPVPAAAGGLDDDAQNSFNKWWSGAGTRRLTSEVGDSDTMPEELEAHQVRLSFREGVPFVIDRPVIEMMMQADYFRGLEDVEDDAYHEKGALEITGFYVDSGRPLDLDGEAFDSEAEVGAARRAGVPSILSLTAAATTGLGMVVLAAMVHGRWKNRPAGRGYSSSTAVVE